MVSSSHTSTSVDADDTTSGETWSVTVTPTDALGGEGASRGARAAAGVFAEASVITLAERSRRALW